MPTISTEELEVFLSAIAVREVELSTDVDPQEVYADHITYRASNGWTIVIFNDANEYDYIQAVESADGRTIAFDEINATPMSWWETIDEALAWQCFGIPGYCMFRCTACGARIPDAIERPRPMVAPFLCGDRTCIGKQSPAKGTWIRVRPHAPGP
jgi:hypothetical protein